MKKICYGASAMLLGLVLAAGSGASAQSGATIAIDAGKTIAEVRQNMYGVFFEDINFGADGGLYGELVKNRSFEFDHPMVGWTPYGDVTVETADPAFERNPHYARITLYGRDVLPRAAGLDNEGFRGMGLREGADYRLTFHARSHSADTMRLRAELLTRANDSEVREVIPIVGSEWKKYSVIVTSNFTDLDATLRMRLVTQGTIDIDHISLFPVDTWAGRENGLRKDLVQALMNLQPGVFRFPGGCVVEGTTLANRYQWKNSVGPVENRPININRWNYNLANKVFPDYYQSYGLGFYEYFLLCEDLGADALPVISCGMACQFENNPVVCVPMDQMQPYVDDALDLIEFANGGVNTKWGRVRAEMGHPEPFGLKMLAVGNEQWGPEYVERLEMFYKQIRARYPEILIIGGAGPYASGRWLDELWPEMKRIGVDLVDEHYYMPPRSFFNSAGRYDSYDRKGPKVFAGEYAAHHGESGKANNFLAALSEASFMTGLERNADIVHLATYAPLFAHVDAWQWNPDLIWFDNLDVLLTPNYYVQQLYSLNKGTHVLATSSPQSNLKGENGLYATSALDRNKKELIIKLANSTEEDRTIRFDVRGLRFANHGTVTTMQSDDPLVVNTLDAPYRIVPVTSSFKVDGNSITIDIKNQSFNVIRINYM